MGFFITFEGIEGSGKTTQIRKAAQYLGRHHIPYITTLEPGGTALGVELRTILLGRTSLHIGERAELFLFAADRMQHVEEVILPAMEAGKVVLCDRFGDATIVYQGCGRGLDIGFVTRVNEYAGHGITPDMTILFDAPVETGLGRVKGRNTAVAGQSHDDRFEREAKAFHERIRQGYLELARAEPGRFRVIDATDAVDEIHHRVTSYMMKLIKG